MPMVDWIQIEASAPGRFVLAGEYADLCEKNAIAVTFDRRTRVVIRPHKKGRLRLNLKNYDNIREWPITSLNMVRLVAKYAEVLEYDENIPKRLNNLLHKRYYQTEPPDTNQIFECETQRKAILDSIGQMDDGVMAFLILYVALGDSYAWSARPELDIEIESDIPIGRGLGSSSALCVAICAALMKLFRVSAEPYIMSNWTTNIDKYFHGVSSALHTSAVIHGGFVMLASNKVKVSGNVKSERKIKVMFIETGVRRDSKRICDLAPDQVIHFGGISNLVNSIWLKIIEADFSPDAIASFLGSNQDNLFTSGLSHERLRDICDRARAKNLTLKQNQGGETAFLLYEEGSHCHQLSAFRNELRELKIKFENHDICYKGLDVNVVPHSAKPG